MTLANDGLPMMSPEAQAAYERAIALLDALPGGPIPIAPFISYLHSLARTPTPETINDALQMFLDRHGRCESCD